MLRMFALVGLVLVFGVQTARAMDADMSSALMSAMDGMDRAMNRITPTGDADTDFARMMIPHHAGAIDMAKAELLYGHDRRLRRLAQEIIVTQESEIQVMRAVLHDPHTPRLPASAEGTSH